MFSFDTQPRTLCNVVALLIVGMCDFTSVSASEFAKEVDLSRLVQSGPTSVTNFIQTYQVASNDKIFSLPKITKFEELENQKIKEKLIFPTMKVSELLSVEEMSFSSFADNFEPHVEGARKIAKSKPNQASNLTAEKVAVVRVADDFSKKEFVTSDLDIKIPEDLYRVETPATKTHANYQQDQIDNIAKQAQEISTPQLAQTSNNEDVSDYESTLDQSSYVSVKLRFADDRSTLDGKRLYPLPGLRVQVVGSPHHVTTDRLGYIDIDQLSTGSRYVLFVDDPLGRVRPASFQVNIPLKQLPYQETFLLARDRIIDTYERIVGSTVRTDMGTLCGYAMSTNVEGQRIPVEGISVGLDIDARGPYYFNRFGYLDMSMGATGSDGRFCFFNTMTGPVAVSFFDKQAYISTHISGIFPGRYHSSIYDIDMFERLRVNIGAAPTSHEQLSSDIPFANSLKAIDMVDVIPLGTGTSMTYLDEGLLGSPDPGSVYHDRRSWVISLASEFESTLYGLRLGETVNSVLPMVPLGFVEDMSVYAQVPYNPSLGSLLIEHGYFTDQDATAGVKVTLYRPGWGEEGREGWYYAEHPTAKSIFFNLEPAMYVVVVEDSHGNWLASETVPIFNETLSFVRTGSQYKRKLKPIR